MDAKPKRRRKGEGIIIEYQPEKWVSRIKINGKQFAFYGITEKEVRKKLDEFKRKIASGKTNHKKQSYGDFLLDDFLKTRKRNMLKSQSYDRLESTIMCHIIESLGFYDVENIDMDTIQKLINAKVPLYAYSSVKKIYDAINESMKFAKSKGMIILNPTELVTLPPFTSKLYKKSTSKTKNKELEIFSDEEIPNFIEAVSATYKNGKPIYKNGNMFLLMLNTGLRLGEVSGLSWQDYDEKNKTVRVHKNIIMAKDERGKKKPTEQDSLKTEDSERTLKLNRNAIAALPQKHVGHNIYCTKDGKPLRPRAVQNTLDSILKRAGIPHRSTHIFRHTFASKLFAKGYDIKIVSELLGHSSVKVTYNTYITLIKKQKA